MKRSGILNGQLAGALARLGHTDQLVVCDVGLPIPRGPEVVDLAFRLGVPSFEDVLGTLLDELVIESSVAAEEVGARNSACHMLLMTRLSPLLLVPHEELKRMVADARLVVRTGEATPYANVILRCGVPF
ncbi:MAG TPA: D-ribose pyranase [Nonomuraea sp.]|nr:D-ribose pyranase [Nonomuraea sp.]